MRDLSNGRKFDRVDHAMNDLVDSWAKREAKASSPSRSEIRIVNDTTNLVEDIAKWIGLCTREASHFLAPEHYERVKFIRDTTARSSSFAKAKRALNRAGGGAVKRKTPSSSGVACVAKVPRITGPTSVPVSRSI